MSTILIISGLIALAAVAIIVLQKVGKIKDVDGDLIPDEVFAVSIHPGMYDDFIEEYQSLFDYDDYDDDDK